MKTFASFIITILISLHSFALPHQVTCYAENVLNDFDKVGNVIFSFDPLKVEWVGTNGKAKVLFNENIVCGRDITNISVRPACLFEDKSDEYLRYTLSCDTKQSDGNQIWFARGGLSISTITKNGRFECRTKYGTSGSIILNLSSCQ